VQKCKTDGRPNGLRPGAAVYVIARGLRPREERLTSARHDGFNFYVQSSLVHQTVNRERLPQFDTRILGARLAGNQRLRTEFRDPSASAAQPDQGSSLRTSDHWSDAYELNGARKHTRHTYWRWRQSGMSTARHSRGGGYAGSAHRQDSLVEWRSAVSLCEEARTGRFVWPQATHGTVALSGAQLSMLLEGIDWRRPIRTADSKLSV